MSYLDTKWIQEMGKGVNYLSQYDVECSEVVTESVTCNLTSYPIDKLRKLLVKCWLVCGDEFIYSYVYRYQEEMFYDRK